MRNIYKYSFPISTILLCGLLLLFLHNLSPKFKQTEQAYKEDRAINLSKTTSKEKLAALLVNNGYVSNSKNANFIADTLTARLKRLEYPNLYYLQKRAYGKVPATVADSVGVLTAELIASKKRLGLDEPIPSPKTDTLNLNKGEGEITVKIYSKDKQSVDNVVVKLVEYSIEGDSAVSNVLGYVKTDSLGVAKIQGLDMARGYSVLPLKKGFEYGSSKGIKLGDFKEYKFFGLFWKNEYVFKFEQLEHRIQMIDNITLKQIKNDGSITVRTPSEYKSTVVTWFFIVLLAWWALAIVLIVKKKKFDTLMLSSVMFLTGLCVLVMFSIQNPLTEELRGVEMASGVIIGMACVLLLQFVDFIKLYQSSYKIDFDIPKQLIRWLFLPFKRKVSWLAPVLSGNAAWYKKICVLLLLGISGIFALLFNIPYISRVNKYIVNFLDRLPKGIGWLISAIILTALLWTPLGKSVGGMIVNLSLFGLTLQPSEIAKYLMIMFMAAFFSQNADSIIKYSRPDKTNLRAKVKTLGWIIGGLLFLILLYAILGDMGPALVVGVTFLLLYSLVKSKVNLDNLTEDDKWKRILTCDFAILVYGVVSFAIFIVVGYIIGHALMFAILWFVFWIIMGLANHRQFFETAFVFNLLVLLFVFGGQILGNIPMLSDTDIAERFEQRTSMCVNTWGVLDIENLGENAKPVSNTQVVNGLWAIATGGIMGQGLGDGNPNLIPAFHTDMILSSIGEQMGWLGLLLIVVVLGVLLRRVVVIGYRVKHPFAFYFCSGVAIVTGVQFFIISLGSSGMIPLTGITVPLMSYGRVSLILNLVALGVVLSLSNNVKESSSNSAVQQRGVGDYNYPVSIVSWTFIVIAFFVLEVWQFYALWRRGNTLIHPVLVESNGLPLIEYNPRIAIINKAMWAGNIYDRNNVLLATSNNSMLSDTAVVNKLVKSGLCKDSIAGIAKSHTKRYYPFEEHLFFMLGDQNKGLFFVYNEDNPIGYMAEAQHLSKLRGYDNRFYNEKNVPVKLRLKGIVKKDSRYLGEKSNSKTKDTTLVYALRNYEHIIPMLKTGVKGSPLAKHNENVLNGKYDIQLTVDAALQTELQNNLLLYAKNGYDKDKHLYVRRRGGLDKDNLLRISVVVLDAEDGDLLTSAIYPLPEYDTMKSEDKEGNKYYNDNKRKSGWTSYSDRDLGLTFASAPGSTAKIMSSMAGLNKLGTEEGSNTKFDIQLYEVIDYKDGKPVEPPMNGKLHDVVDMRTALVVSSNCYYIDLVNQCNLYKDLQTIYSQAGVVVGGKCTYKLNYPDNLNSSILDKVINDQQDKALTSWLKYTQDKHDGLFVNGRDKQKLRRAEWMWAWGQGTLDATPLSMARVVSAVVNDGEMPVTRFMIDEKTSSHPLVSKSSANAIKSFMRQQYEENAKKGHLSKLNNIGGKTGTPHRAYKGMKERKSRNLSDGWYVFYVDNGNDKSKHNIAVAVRMERVGKIGGSSTDAMWLSREVVIPTLEKNNYIVRR